MSTPVQICSYVHRQGHKAGVSCQQAITALDTLGLYCCKHYKLRCVRGTESKSPVTPPVTQVKSPVTAIYQKTVDEKLADMQVQIDRMSAQLATFKLI